MFYRDFSQSAATIIVIAGENPYYNDCHNYPYPDICAPLGVVAARVTARVAAVGIVKHRYFLLYQQSL